MFQKLKHFFIPHEGNNYKPHFFRESSIVVLVVAITILFILSGAGSWAMRKTDLGAAVLSSVLINITNESRTSNNEVPLIKNPALETAAKMKAQDMASKSYFAHTSPDGLTPWHWFEKAGYHFIYAGENLAIDFTESTDVETAWLASPTHRANILNGKFTEIGVATEDGFYQGHPTTFVVQTFGTPISYAQATPEPVSPVVTTTAKPSPVTVVTAPEVKGAATDTEKKLVTLAETDKFVAVQDTSVAVPDEQVPLSEIHYSSWLERLLVKGPLGISALYIVLMGLVLAALMMMIFIEIRRQHPKNIFYGVSVVLFLMTLAYANYAIFVPHFVQYLF